MKIEVRIYIGMGENPSIGRDIFECETINIKHDENGMVVQLVEDDIIHFIKWEQLAGYTLFCSDRKSMH